MTRTHRLQLSACVTGACIALLLQGCEGYLVFGTATKFGLDISQRADQNIDVTLGYQRVEAVSIPAPKEKEVSGPDGKKDGQGQSQGGSDASKDRDTYSVIGRFHVKYGNPFFGEPLELNQLFATGHAARLAAKNKQMMEAFGRAAGTIAKESEEEKKQ